MAAVKAVQNTGNTGLPNDVVDRRPSRTSSSPGRKNCGIIYGSLVGKGQPGDLQPASGVKDLDALPSYGWVPVAFDTRALDG
jgi:hypothetical protein